MPIANEKVVIAYETQEEFDALQTKDENTIYFVTDTNRIFVGNSQYYGIMEYRVVETLPQAGVRGTIYLIAHQHGERDIYDEYLWVTDKYEKIGNTDIDLSGYIPVVTGANNKIPKFNSQGKLVPTDFELNKTVPSDAVFTDTTYNAATQAADGLMSASDKTKLDGITVSNYLRKDDIVTLTAAEYEALTTKTAPYYFITDV